MAAHIKVLMVDVDGVVVGHPERRWHHHMKRDLGLDPRLLFDHFFPVHWAAASFFREATLRSGFAAEEIGFIDDLEDNVIAARAFGWRAAVWTHDSRLAEVLAAWSLATHDDERLAY